MGFDRFVQEKKGFVNKNKEKTKKETKRRPFIGRLEVFEVSNFLFWLLLYTTPRNRVGGGCRDFSFYLKPVILRGECLKKISQS